MRAEALDMGMYNKAMIEEPLDGFDLFLKEERGVDKDFYWGLPINEQIALEDAYYAHRQGAKEKKGSECCG